MANVLVNRARMTVSGTPGTGAITLLAASTSFDTFADAGVANGNTVSYFIEDGTSWEWGTGTYSSTGPTLTRTTVGRSSSGAATAISLTSAAVVSLTALAADVGLPVDFQQFDASGTWTKPLGYKAGAVVYIRAWGAGASGGKGAAYGGGGGGGYKDAWMKLSDLAATVTVTIGAGGTAKTVAATVGSAGGNSTFGTHVTGYGGGAGTDTVGGGGGGPQGAGTVNPGIPRISDGIGPMGTGCNGTTIGRDAIWHGGGGGAGSNIAGTSSVYGGGGGGGIVAAGGSSSFAGAGGAGVSAGAGGIAGAVPGGGGGATATGTASGAGGAGRIIVTVFDGV